MPPLSGTFHLQGHRGARGLKRENTLPSFEAALDAGASSVETDLLLTRDGAVVLCHEPLLETRLFTPPAADAPRAALADLTLAQLRRWRADRNPEPARFPHQDAEATPLALWYIERYGIDLFAVPTLADLFRFAADYAGEPGAAAGKTQTQRIRAAGIGFDLELKRVPFHSGRIGDGFTGRAPGLLERRVAESVAGAGVADRTTVRAFDHRSVRWLRTLEPRLTGAVLVAHTAPVAPGEVALRADAWIYCPSCDFLDDELVRQAHAAGVRVLPWTVNDPEDWKRLIDWGVDGLTTDYPDRMAEWLYAQGIAIGIAWEGASEGAVPR
jgi:glycerophosphoryl diester phosphodiesterase